MEKGELWNRRTRADVVLVSGLERIGMAEGVSYLGHDILRSILRRKYAVELVNFDLMNNLESSPFHYGVDLQRDLAVMTEYILSLKPLIVGFYTICSSFLSVMELARRIHEQAPKVKIMYGGPHATMTADACLVAQPYIAAVCCGESERSILPLVTALLTEGELCEVSGIAFLRDGVVVRTPPAPLLDSRELFSHDVPQKNILEGYHGGPISLEAGRGCPYSCTFCSTRKFWKHRFRIKPLDVLLSEMERTASITGCRIFNIEHDIFTANREYLLSFCDSLIDKGSPYQWHCSSRVDVLDRMSLSRMAEAGCFEIFFGIETGSERMQAKISKNLNLTRAVDTLQYANKCGIRTRCSFIYGFVEETEEDLDKTFSLMERLFITGCDKLYLHRFFPLPCTEEADKIYDKLYFTPDEVDSSIYARRTIDDEGLSLIRKHKELFLPFYTFDSPIRKKYVWIEATVAFLSYICLFFPESAKYLIRRYGIKGLYVRCQDMFRELQLELGEMLSDGRSKQLVVKYLNRIHKILSDDPFFSAILVYERDWHRFCNGNSMEEKHVYPVDIFLAYRGDYQMGTHRYCFTRKPEGPVSSEIAATFE